MTVPEAPAQPNTPPTVIDGKYNVLRELSREGNMTLYEVESGAGVTRRVAWFAVGNNAERQGFHAYRTALRSLAPAGLTDVVARPGAYYAVWQDVQGTPLAEAAAQPTKRLETIEAVRGLQERLAEHGFALSDADILLEGPQGIAPRIAYLRPAPLSRTAQDIAALNAPVLAGLSGGKVKKPRKPREPGAWLSFLPGLLFLAGAGWLGAQAAQVYLNPPVGKVGSVTGKPARDAAQSLTKAGFRVEYTYGDSGSVPVGAVIRQDPDPGTELPIGRLVSLTVNNPAPLTVPKIEDLTPEQAQAPLKDNALKLGKTLKVDGTLSNTPEGRIIAQVPAPGATTQRGQPIQVLVSTGVQGRETWIPDLTGLTFEQARAHARAAGLVVTEVTKEPSDRTENIVLRQDPKPFVRVTVGGPVKLVIASAKFTPPSTPTGPVPVPPPYVPPVEPETPAPGTDNSGNQTAPPQNQEQNQTDQNQPEQQNTEQQTTGQQNTVRRVNFYYKFPADLPAGSYSVAVQDQSGEREMMPATDSTKLAGQEAQSAVDVTGAAIFIIRANGAEYARVNPQ